MSKHRRKKKAKPSIKSPHWDSKKWGQKERIAFERWAKNKQIIWVGEHGGVCRTKFQVWTDPRPDSLDSQRFDDGRRSWNANEMHLSKYEARIGHWEIYDKNNPKHQGDWE